MFENIKLGYRLINVNNAAFDVAAKVEEMFCKVARWFRFFDRKTIVKYICIISINRPWKMDI